MNGHCVFVDKFHCFLSMMSAYVAVVWGLPVADSYTIKAPLGRLEGQAFPLDVPF